MLHSKKVTTYIHNNVPNLGELNCDELMADEARELIIL